jgi:hypothetical protein
MHNLFSSLPFDFGDLVTSLRSLAVIIDISGISWSLVFAAHLIAITKCLFFFPFGLWEELHS